MRIEKLESWILRFPLARPGSPSLEMELTGVTATGETGQAGTGFTFIVEHGGGEAVKALIDNVLARRVIGRDAEDVRAIWQDVWWVTHRLGTGIPMMAIAAIDIALWDLCGKGAGRSLASLLGQQRKSLPVYGSLGLAPDLGVERLLQNARGYVEDGYRAIKVRVGAEPEADVRRVEAVRKAVGPDVRIMCDALERMRLPEAIWLGARLADQGVFWLEEPIHYQQLAQYETLARVQPTPIALGEHLFSRFDFAPFVERRAASVLQPDACVAGGVTEVMRIGDLAEANGLVVAPHMFPEVHVHIAASLAAAIYVEAMPMFEGLVTAPARIEGGEIEVPAEPGHGLEFLAETWDRFRVA
jgi:L-talarate/galactarate dehydratase